MLKGKGGVDSSWTLKTEMEEEIHTTAFHSISPSVYYKSRERERELELENFILTSIGKENSSQCLS